MKGVWFLVVCLMALNGVSAFFLWQNQQLNHALTQHHREFASHLPLASVNPVAVQHCEPVKQVSTALASTPLEAAPKIIDFNEPLKAGVAVKYALLLDALNLGRLERDALEQLMFKREQLLNLPLAGYFVEGQDADTLIADQEHKLADIDEQVAQLLGPDAAQRYQLLKDSDLEQFQLREFEQGLAVGNALEPDTRVRLLLSKLRHKKNFELALQSLNDLPFDSALRSEEMSKGLQRYQRNYYAEVELLLDEPSMARLKQLEDQHFEEMARSLGRQ